MTESDFWGLINMLDWDMAGDDEAVVGPLVDVLSQKGEEEIFSFEEILSEKLYQLDAEKYAVKRNIFGMKKREYISADDFLYTRCVVVANGEEFYEEVMQNPRRFPHDLEFEMLLVVSNLAYTRRTGKIWEYIPKINYETYSNENGWK